MVNARCGRYCATFPKQRCCVLLPAYYSSTSTLGLAPFLVNMVNNLQTLHWTLRKQLEIEDLCQRFKSNGCAFSPWSQWLVLYFRRWSSNWTQRLKTWPSTCSRQTWGESGDSSATKNHKSTGGEPKLLGQIKHVWFGYMYICFIIWFFIWGTWIIYIYLIMHMRNSRCSSSFRESRSLNCFFK